MIPPTLIPLNDVISIAAREATGVVVPCGDCCAAPGCQRILGDDGRVAD